MYWNAKKAKIKLLSIWLTLTWDVLKFVGGINGLISGVQININMRCIEITFIDGCQLALTD